MFASEPLLLQATASQVLALLEEHRRAVARMVAAWPDVVAYEQVAAQLDRMRILCAPLPGLGGAWSELLISHAELVQVLWRAPAGGRVDEAALAQASAAHARAAARLDTRLLHVGATR